MSSCIAIDSEARSTRARRVDHVAGKALPFHLHQQARNLIRQTNSRESHSFLGQLLLPTRVALRSFHPRYCTTSLQYFANNHVTVLIVKERLGHLDDSVPYIVVNFDHCPTLLATPTASLEISMRTPTTLAAGHRHYDHPRRRHDEALHRALSSTTDRRIHPRLLRICDSMITIGLR